MRNKLNANFTSKTQPQSELPTSYQIVSKVYRYPFNYVVDTFNSAVGVRMEYIAGEHRTQSILFPDSLDNYVAQDNPVRVIDVYVDSLDLKNLEFTTSTAQTGRPPYNPADLLKLYMYGYLNKIRSSRKLEQETKRNLELMWLTRKRLRRELTRHYQPA